MFKPRRYAILLGLAVALSLIISACGSSTDTTGSTPTSSGPSTLGTPGQYNCVPGTLTVSGSTALQPLVTAVATDYSNKCKGASITVNGGGSSTGKANVEAGSVGIGDSDTPSSTAQADLVDHQVAVVIFGIIVNSDAGVTNLTTAQIQGIYAGTITNWKQAGGKDLPIVAVSRPTTSGTRATFAQYVLGHTEKITGPASLVSDTTGTVVKEVGSTNGAIGYAATGQVPAGGAAAVISIDGNMPSVANVESNTYKFWNVEHMYTKGKATGLAQALIDYMSSDDGHKEETTLQFVDLSQMQASSISAHNAVPKPAA
ncbi:MAG TPA: phosphate ABC transporter substrate-binding protein [Ktedonobacteraceae bacterium]